MMDALESTKNALHLAIEREQSAADEVRQTAENRDHVRSHEDESRRVLADTQTEFDGIRVTTTDAESRFREAEAEYKRKSDLCTQFENDLKGIRSEIDLVSDRLDDAESGRCDEEAVLHRINEKINDASAKEEEEIKLVEERAVYEITRIRSGLDRIESNIKVRESGRPSVKKQEQLIKQCLETLDRRSPELDLANEARSSAEESFLAVADERRLAEAAAIKKDVKSAVKNMKDVLKQAKSERNGIRSDIRKLKRSLLFSRGENREKLHKMIEISKNDLEKSEIAMQKAERNFNAAKLDKKREPSRVSAARKELAGIIEKEEKLEGASRDADTNVQVAEQNLGCAIGEFNKARSDLGWVHWELNNLRKLDDNKQKLLKNLEEEEKRLKEVEDMRGQAKIFDELRSSGKESQNRLKDVEDEIRHLKAESSDLTEREDSIYTDLEKVMKGLDEHGKIVAEEEKALEEKRSEYADVRNSVELAETDLKFAIEETETVEDGIAQAISRMLAEESEVAAAEEELGRITAETLDATRRKLEERSREEIEQLTAELETARDEVAEMRSEHERLSTELEQRSREETEQLTTELESARNEVAEMRSEHERLSTELEERSREETEQLTTELESARNEVSETRSRYDRLASELESTKLELEQKSGEELEGLTTELESTRNEVLETRSDYDRLTSELEAARENLLTANDEIAGLKEVQEASGGAPAGGGDADVKNLLIALDKLLENLSDDLIEKFASSDDFVLYEKVLDEYGI